MHKRKREPKMVEKDFSRDQKYRSALKLRRANLPSDFASAIIWGPTFSVKTSCSVVITDWLQTRVQVVEAVTCLRLSPSSLLWTIHLIKLGCFAFKSTFIFYIKTIYLSRAIIVRFYLADNFSVAVASVTFAPL